MHLFKEDQKGNALEELDEMVDEEADTYTLSLSSTGLSKLGSDSKVNVAGYFEDALSSSQKSSLINDEILPLVRLDVYKILFSIQIFMR